ncbi:hypothetical protein K432DRAFT_285895 [Lepidopterella palustris CBS 459.81]|uniref:BHLH domain-containing protein n=1 Tax=Lepidopterella palustris CBS 459.81 TaxID=1314670 RepID=A0A8E2ELA1_9PEZI|nr:hypothetical protein K432DRAFT_285895 [Lepidopterella palustris CBS 459.81]
MSLNWNAFLTDEGLNLPNERWADTQRTTAGRSSDIPTSSSTFGSRQSLNLAHDPSDLSPFESAVTGNGDSYFTDAYYGPGDYFLSDLEVLQPFGDTIAGDGSTSESSPEPTNGISLTGHTVFQPKTEPSSSTSQTPNTTSSLSPAISSQPPKPVQRAQTFPNSQFQSMFPNTAEAGFVEDLTFPNGPTGMPNTKTTALENTSSQSAGGNTTVKRSRGKPDSLSACWTSPLCPNHDKDAPPPNPSTCGAGCAPFLFADEPTPTVNSQLLAQDVDEQEITEGIVEIKPRSKKRSESESSREPSGRQFSKSTSVEIRPRLKSESSQDSPEQLASQPPEETKGKSRRRLPHNQVERKYRESLNTQLDSLRRVVPALQQNQRACDSADIEDLPTPSKPSKAVVLASATAYIKQMEKDKKSLADENQLLKTRIKALQALVKCEDCSLMQYVMDLKIHNPT